MDLSFAYRITYSSGQTYDRSFLVTVEVSNNDYLRIVQGIQDHKQLDEIEGIDEILAEAREKVISIDRCIWRSGTSSTLIL